MADKEPNNLTRTLTKSHTDRQKKTHQLFHKLFKTPKEDIMVHWPQIYKSIFNKHAN